MNTGIIDRSEDVHGKGIYCEAGNNKFNVRFESIPKRRLFMVPFDVWKIRW